MNTWNDLKQKIETRDLRSSTWLSDRRRLLEIIQQAEKSGMNPTNASRASISNLRTIINVARKAIKHQDFHHLSILFEWAAELPTSDLRVRIGSHVREEIKYKQISIDGNSFYQILVTIKQFEKIRMATKGRYIYRELRQKPPETKAHK